MDINQKVRDNIRALAKMKGKPITQLSEEAGIYKEYLSRKNYRLHLDVTVRYAELLGVTLDNLVYNDYSKEYEKNIAVNKVKGTMEKIQKKMSKYELRIALKEYLNGLDEELPW